MIDLIPKALRLHKGPMHEIEQKFTKRFGVFWNNLAISRRKPIARYLKAKPGIAYLCFRMDFDSSGAYGRCAYFDDRTILTFSAAYFDLAKTDDLRDAVIAHELAHIHRRGTNEWTGESDREEELTRQLALSWGYKTPVVLHEDQATIDTSNNEWIEEHRSRYGQELESLIIRCAY